MSPWDIPVFRMAYFPIPHRPTFGAPVFRRAYWLRQTLRLQPLHGLHQSTLCFFFQNAHASGSLRSPSEPRTVLSSLCAFLQNARPPGSLRSPSEPRTVLPFLCAFLQNAHAPGSLRSPSVCAPNPAPLSRLFVLFRSAYFPSSHRNLLSEGSGVPHGLFCNSAPNRLFKPLRCSGRLIRQAETLDLQPLRGLRTPHRSPVSSPLAAAAALWLPCVRGAVRRQAGLRGYLRVRGKGKGPAVPFPSLRTESAFQAAPVFRSAYSASRNARPPAASRPPSKHTVLFLPKRSCFRFASLTLRLRTETFFQKVPVFRMAYSAPTAHCAVSSETLMLQPLRGLRTPHRPIVSSPLAAAAD